MGNLSIMGEALALDLTTHPPRGWCLRCGDWTTGGDPEGIVTWWSLIHVCPDD